MDGRNLLVTTPTASGKTLVALIANEHHNERIKGCLPYSVTCLNYGKISRLSHFGRVGIFDRKIKLRLQAAITVQLDESWPRLTL